MKKNQLNKFSTLKPIQWAYLAGFLDGDGSLSAQIVPRRDYKLGFQIRVSIVFYQHNKRHWYIMKIHKLLSKTGYVRVRNDNMSELTIVEKKAVKEILLGILPYSWAKQSLVKLLLKIIDHLDKVKTRDDFLGVCQLVDKVADFTDSKKRVNTSEKVKEFFHTPVET